MERLTLDQAGARTGSISESSMQFGDETVAIGNIATMKVEDDRFKPWDTERNRSAAKMYYGFALISGLLLAMGLLWWMFAARDGGEIFAPAVITLASGLVFGLVFWRALRISSLLDKTMRYHRLIIGASDGRQLMLVDDSRPTLEQIRDVLRHKVDTDDRAQRATFDLNADHVEITPGSQA